MSLRMAQRNSARKKVALFIRKHLWRKRVNAHTVHGFLQKQDGGVGKGIRLDNYDTRELCRLMQGYPKYFRKDGFDWIPYQVQAYRVT